MKIIYTVSIIFLAIAFTECNPGKKVVKKTYAYSSIRMPGTVPVDINGRALYKGPDTTTLVYVETANDGIMWEHARNGNRSFHVKPVRINNIPLELGYDKSTGKSVILSPEQGNQLWQLVLTPVENIYTKEALKGEILLEGTYKNKKFTKKINNLSELSGPDAQ